MPTIDPTIIAQIRKDGLLREGHFAFRSGRHSAALLDRDLLLADPSFASHLGYAIAKRFFTSHIQAVAAPSIWGAGLAQWIAYFLEPKAKVVYATPNGNELAVADPLVGLIRGSRVLVVDNLVVSGDTLRRFTAAVEELGGEVIGLGTLWNLAGRDIAGHPVFGILNTLYDAYPPEECPLCAAGAGAPTIVAY